LADRADETSTARIIYAGLGDKQVEGQMTRLRQIVLGSLAALAMGGAASSALAEQSGTFQNRLNGATIGLPLGALPPPGIYTGLETAYLGLIGGPGGHGNQGAGLFFPAVAQAVPILVVPGWNFLGASYAFSVVQAGYMNGASASMGNLNTAPTGELGFNETMANTTWNPIVLSWNLGSGWFVSAGFNFMAPDGSRYAGTPNPDYWTYEPTLAVSYLANNWVASANFFYDINGQSTGPCCTGTTKPVTSGNTLYGDFTVLYKFGKWEIGPVAYFETQTTADSGAGCTITPTACVTSAYTVDFGALVGYDFGPVDIQVWFTQSVAARNFIDSNIIWSRIGFKLWGFDAPKPLVAKN
jgi:hypothetical protein